MSTSCGCEKPFGETRGFHIEQMQSKIATNTS